MTYSKWLKSKNYEVTEEEYNGHKNFLLKVMPVKKELMKILRDYGGHFDYPNTKFSEKEQKILEAAKIILEHSIVPLALLKKKQ